MNTVFKIFLSMSFSGGLLILTLLLGKRWLKDKISRQWQYYIWLVVILRLLLPFGPEVSLLGKTYQAVDWAVTRADALPARQPAPNIPGDMDDAPAAGLDQKNEYASSPSESDTDVRPFQDIAVLLTEHIWLIWLVAALVLLIRKVTIYQGFMRYIRAGLTPVSDMELLDRLSIAAEQSGIKRPIELCVNPLVSSPLLTGFFHPCIVLPGTDVPEKDFSYIVLHELTHYKRRDMFFKWLIQVTVCLHWFNPFVHLMSSEITRACEFSCDEAVLSKIGSCNAQDYGKTLLDAMAAIGKYKENIGAVTLSENKQMLKERLGAIMKFKGQSKAVKLLTAALTLCVVLGASFVGVYSTVTAANTPNATNTEKLPLAQSGVLPEMETLDIDGTTYYLVQNEEQLRAIGTGRYGMDQNYLQQADIQLSTNEWIPIGTRKNPFTGTFNGNGFEITGLTMTDPYAELVGLFGVARNAHIYNITVRDEDITSAGRNAAITSVGGIVAIGGSAYDNTVYPKVTDKNEWQDDSRADDDLPQENAISSSYEKQYIASMQADQYYEAGSLPLFDIAFSQLDKGAQESWLDRLYTDGSVAFFSAAVKRLDGNSSLPADFAEKAYADEQTAFFSILTDCMGEAELKLWLDRALEDGNIAFQSILFDKLQQNDVFDELQEKREKELEEAQAAEYRTAGVTMNGKDYYYEGQLVNIFLDIRPGKSFYTLNMNPKGTVNIKIVRDADNKITGAIYMTETEVTQLLEDMMDDD
ncbi:M56 family metallopeptidase [Parablautia intestinalis]|jgi:beta-lactamase regulating signal transducer with metallopeptidase domain|uniref:M56 family metallopeptidase n=1 Tax=Parablautia intestinalis TaxID=2320100 RepID=UPI00256F32E9|nr:M56 family metallopeptidase [Parablautia intestinalis]